MYFKVKKDKKLLRSQRKVELSKKLIKSVFFNRYIPIKDRLRFFFFLDKQKLGFSKIINRCFITGRGRVPYKNLGISRMELKSKGSLGFLHGFRRSSW